MFTVNVAGSMIPVPPPPMRNKFSPFSTPRGKKLKIPHPTAKLTYYTIPSSCFGSQRCMTYDTSKNIIFFKRCRVLHNLLLLNTTGRSSM